MVTIRRNKFGGIGDGLIERIENKPSPPVLRRQAPGFTPGEVDIQPNNVRPTTRQAPGFMPGVIDLSNLFHVGR